MLAVPKRIFYGWWIVAASTLGLFFGAAPVAVYSFSIFLKPIAADFHAGRAAVALGFTIHNLCSTVSNVFIGRIIDRFGVRWVVFPAVALVGLLFISTKLIGSNIWQFYLFYFLLGLISPATVSVPYGTLVARWFDRHRGLALGLMSLGLGLGAIFIPPIAQRLIALYGWRSAYAAFGFATLLVPIPVLAAVLKEDPHAQGLAPDGDLPRFLERTKPQTVEGDSWQQILLHRTFWLLLIGFFLAGASAHACVLHLSALLTDRGATPQAAATAASVVGVAILLGRVGSGYFLDRFFAPRVTASIFGLAAVGIALLALGIAGPFAVAASFLVGLSFGAEAEVMVYLLSRYFGLRALGSSFGVAFASFVLAGAFGTYTMGAGFDRNHSYNLPLVLFLLLMAAASFLFTRLGPYRFVPSAALRPVDTTSSSSVSEVSS